MHPFYFDTTKLRREEAVRYCIHCMYKNFARIKSYVEGSVSCKNSESPLVGPLSSNPLGMLDTVHSTLSLG